MAPEQFEGQAIDARTDIFAFGAVLYEMVSGRKAFEGSSIGSLIAAIVERDPPALSSVQPLAPAALDRIVATCLAKDPDDRFQTARDLMRALQWVRERRRRPVRRRGDRLSVPLGRCRGGHGRPYGHRDVVMARRAAAQPCRTSASRSTPSRAARSLPSNASVVAPQFALSPDGRHIVYVATSDGPPRLWVRTLSALSARPLDGTEDASDPFWSPDSRSIAFFSQGKIKVVDLSGGLPVVRGDASRDTRGRRMGARRDDTDSRVPRPTVCPVWHRTGRCNPCSRTRLPGILCWIDFRGYSRTANISCSFTAISDPSVRGIYLAALGSNARTRLTDGDWGPVVVDDHLLYLRGPTLMAQRLNVRPRAA